MMSVIMENAGTIIVSLVLIAVVMLILVVMHRDRKRGKSSCGSSCGCCPMAGTCHGKKHAKVNR